MIPDDDIEKALEWLSGNGRNAAKARAERETLDAYTKVLKATIMRENASESLGAQEARAYADPRYLTHIKALEEAIFMDEGFKWRRATEETRIEVWRSQQANERALGKI
jgi:hypothetical protein